jgi:cobalamin biosynthesis Mg chelatase CobN
MVTATSPDGGTLSYQWYLNDTDNTTGGTAVGSGDASYMPSTATVGTAYYYVVVTNTNDAVNGEKTATATSETAAVMVSAPIGTSGNNNAGSNTGNTGGVGAKAGDNGGSSNDTTPNAESSTDPKSDAKDGIGTDTRNGRADNGSNSNEDKPDTIRNSDTPRAQSDSDTDSTGDSSEKSKDFPWWILIVICTLAVGAIIVAVVKRRNRDEEDHAV